MTSVQKVTLILLAVITLSFSAVAHATGLSLEEQVIENQKGYPSWYIGKGIVPGESLTYHICDLTMKSTLNGATTCYQARLDFVSLLQDHTGGVWIVQAVFTPDGSTSQWPSILYITEDFGGITTDGSSMNYATSLSHTLLYLQKYANTFKPQKLEIGSSWGFVDDYVSPVPQLTVTRFTSIDTGSNSTGVYEVGFDVVKDNTIYIKDGFPFPVEQTIYDSEGYSADPPILYQLKLETDNVQNGTSQAIDVKELCSNPLLTDQISSYTMPSANNVNQTQLKTLQNNTMISDENYTRPLNVTSEEQIQKELRSLGGNLTNSTR
ncbi:MAG: hypothetical protein ACREBI_07765 [Nitrosotalea sp.]